MQGCKPEELNVSGFKVNEMNPEYAIPVFKSKLSLENLIKGSNSFIKKESDGFVSLVYRGTIFSTTAGSSINIPDQIFSEKIVLNASHVNALTNNQSQTINFQSMYSFAIGAREIDSLWLKAGKMAASITSQIKTGGVFKVTIEDLEKAGTKQSLIIPFSYRGSLPIDTSKSLILDNCHWNMSKGVPAYNNVRISYEITLNPTTEILKIGDPMNIELNFNGIKFSRFYGYIGQVNLLNAADTINISVFGDVASGQFSIDDPKIKIITSNSYGVPVKAGFTRLAGYSPGGTSNDITGIPNTIPVQIPNINQVGQVLYDSVILNKSSSNLATIISSKPKKIIFQAYIDLNPNGKQQRNFVTDNSVFKYIVDVELPLYGSARDFVLESVDAINFDMPEEDLIEKMLVRFTGINGFPIDLFTQVYLIDSSNNAFDSIFTDKSYRFLESAAIGTDGKVISPTKKVTDIEFDIVRAKRLTKLKKIKTRIGLGTTSNGGTYPNVKLYANYSLDVSMGVKVKLKVKLDKL